MTAMEETLWKNCKKQASVQAVLFDRSIAKQRQELLRRLNAREQLNTYLQKADKCTVIEKAKKNTDKEIKNIQKALKIVDEDEKMLGYVPLYNLWSSSNTDYLNPAFNELDTERQEQQKEIVQEDDKEEEKHALLAMKAEVVQKEVILNDIDQKIGRAQIQQDIDVLNQQKQKLEDELKQMQVTLDIVKEKVEAETDGSGEG